jgi:hypothetical protein
MIEKEVTDYRVVSNTNMGRFEQEVKSLMAKGWSVYGNVAHGYSDDSEGRAIYSVQVLVKYQQTQGCYMYAKEGTQE